ncbi:MAG: long-chain-fatty-acid--CoA ligase [Euryarchaeota archaeon ADurb.Bin023]|uniref:Long-chain-fatty-acid--CoA ligase n=1 Tax=Candidatus Methanofastidiosum methylothiophilum TaxID=1705564 RepID=A0A150JMY5_9EURY|nr:MAG: long-chain-fatty-acid--CoA ligase [Candidatus Methanofastidiosum methylthiophilus]KYC58567.1 MAG: long-chain-fatty-acid--CoA ligase [Candidatus Methanofastidiosum methylthiophilus]OQC50584.1 MAG: long-chain-fatty-acid--CoA ligase [Euryarchaeota archaeon ADurb.Bin023]
MHKTVEEIRKSQGKLLVKNVKYSWDNIPYYKQKMKEAGVKPEDIKGLDDISKIPFLSKADLRHHYPYGLIATPLDRVVRFHSSSGTTGIPTVVPYTKKDIENWAELNKRCLETVGATNKDIVQVSYGYGLFTGGLGLHYGAERLGAAVIPASSGNTMRQIKILKDMKTTTLACTPSYALMLSELMKANDVKIETLSLKRGVFGAESWSENMRKRIEKGLGLEAFDIYGLTELCGPGVGIECSEHNGLHTWSDHFIVETIDSEGNKTDVDGEGKGELVFTTLQREAMPVLRYRTKDLSSITWEECACGLLHPRIGRITGRSDDMLIVRGVNVFPSQIEEVLMELKGVGDHYQIIVDRDILDCLMVKVEVTNEIFSDSISELITLEKEIKKRLFEMLSLNVDVELVEPGQIPRPEGKAKRVVDLRKDM